MKHFVNITIILLVFLNINIFAQHPPCMPEYENLSYKFPNYTNIPLYSTDMPYDVLIGYIAMDSVCRYDSLWYYQEFFKRQTYNDTIKKIMRFMYKMDDYNPVLFNYSIRTRAGKYQYFAKDLIESLVKVLAKHSPNPYLDRVLIENSYILHILVTDTLYNGDPNNTAPSGDIYNVTAQVLDTIKGKVFPTCKNLYPNTTNIDIHSINNNTCFQFLYSPAWGFWRDGYGTRIENEDGSAWIKKDKEYIVFISSSVVCSDYPDLYYTNLPIGMTKYKTETFRMFPIENGYVYDPINELGLGVNLTTEQWKNALRNKINIILNY